MSLKISATLESSLLEQLSPKVMDALQKSLKSSIEAIQDRWKKEVQKQIGNNAQVDFTASITPLEDFGFSGYIQILRDSPKNFGSPIDLKRGFNKSPKATKTKDGWQVNLPFSGNRRERTILKAAKYSGLQRIVKGYQNEKQSSQYYPFGRRNTHITKQGINSIIPFAKQTIVESLNTNLSSI